jgi:hypothetical protein
MSSEKEKLLRSGKRNWIGLLIVWAIFFCQHFMEGIPSPFIYLGAALIIFFLLRAFQFGRKIKQNPELAIAMNDEYIQHIRLKSYRTTYWVVSVIIVSLLFLKDVLSLSTESVLLIILFALFFTPAIILLIMDREK